MPIVKLLLTVLCLFHASQPEAVTPSRSKIVADVLAAATAAAASATASSTRPGPTRLDGNKTRGGDEPNDFPEPDRGGRVEKCRCVSCLGTALTCGHQLMRDGLVIDRRPSDSWSQSTPKTASDDDDADDDADTDRRGSRPGPKDCESCVVAHVPVAVEEPTQPSRDTPFNAPTQSALSPALVRRLQTLLSLLVSPSSVTTTWSAASAPSTTLSSSCWSAKALTKLAAELAAVPKPAAAASASLTGTADATSTTALSVGATALSASVVATAMSASVALAGAGAVAAAAAVAAAVTVVAAWSSVASTLALGVSGEPSMKTLPAAAKVGG
eukprot:m.265331 g.265331  ORF g.265331 m.265331 type:complete len:328 (+) comp19259_c0_seq2:290-1273(+)